MCGRTLGASYKVCDECHRTKVGCTGGEEHGQPMPPINKLPQRRAVEKSKPSASDTGPLPSHSKVPTKAIVEVETVAAVDRRVKLETQIKSLVSAVEGLTARLDNLGSIPATLADVKRSVDELIYRTEGPSDEYGAGPEDFDMGGWGDDKDQAEMEDRAEGEEVADKDGEKQVVTEGENEIERGEADDSAQPARSPMADDLEGNMDVPADEDEGEGDAQGEDEVQGDQEGQDEDAADGNAAEGEIAGED